MIEHKSINEKQRALVAASACLREDPDTFLEHITALGEEMATLSPKEKVDKNLVRGCLAKVWLVITYHDERVFLRGDSNSLLTKGLVGLIIDIFSGQKVADVLAAKLDFMEQLDFHTLLSAQRRGGLASIMEHIRTNIKKHYPPLHKGGGEQGS